MRAIAGWYVAGMLVVSSTAPGARSADTPELTVYTYSALTTDWSIGATIEPEFEALCGCDLRFVAVDDGVSILSRLRLEGPDTDADIVLGLDTNLTAEARATGLFEPHGMDLSGLDLPITWQDKVFVPFDWGYLALIYDESQLSDPPESLRELVFDSTAELIIQDPRTSTPGLSMMLWMKSVFGDEAPAAWQALRPRIVTVTTGWSESYGMFLEGEAPMVVSYTTSPAYHLIEEGTSQYRAAPLAEGHYMQIEVMAKLAGSDQPDLADAFLDFMLSPTVQDIIPTGHWMYPVVMPADGLPEAYDGLVQPADALLFADHEVAENRAQWTAEWLDAMSR